MTKSWDSGGIWLLYDGECPLCSSTARAMRLYETYGPLHLLDARTSVDHPLHQLATEMELDLDEGMVIVADGRLYHGDAALLFLARHGDGSRVVTALVKFLFRFKWMARLVYPWLRATRNRLLRAKSIGQIDNLSRHEEPIFKAIFGSAWEDLPPVFQAHYANRPYTDDRTRAVGVMDVACYGPMKVLAPVLNLLGQIPAKTETDVSVAVEYTSEVDTKAFHFHRMFAFSKGAPYTFRSRMIQVRNGDVVEIMRFGLCWRLRYGWNGGKVTLSHRGYALALFGHVVPLPLTWVLGQANAVEIAVDQRSFDMSTRITHPLWGLVYEYKGRFRVVEAPR